MQSKFNVDAAPSMVAPEKWARWGVIVEDMVFMEDLRPGDVCRQVNWELGELIRIRVIDPQLRPLKEVNDAFSLDGHGATPVFLAEVISGMEIQYFFPGDFGLAASDVGYWNTFNRTFRCSAEDALAGHGIAVDYYADNADSPQEEY
jgi:hypothetical protein